MSSFSLYLGCDSSGGFFFFRVAKEVFGLEEYMRGFIFFFFLFLFQPCMSRSNCSLLSYYISHPDKVKLSGNDTVDTIANKFVEITKAYKSYVPLFFFHMPLYLKRSHPTCVD